MRLVNFDKLFLLVLIFIYSCIDKKSPNLYPISNEYGKYGYIDSLGKIVIKCEFDCATDFSNERALVLLNGKAFYIDKNGKVLFNAKIRPTVTFLNKTNIATSLDSINRNNFRYNSLLTKQDFLNLENIYYFHEGLAAYYDTSCNAYGFINIDGEIEIKPKFYEVEYFSEDYCVVMLLDSNQTIDNMRYGYIDKSGATIIKPIFYRATKFSKGKAFVNLKDNLTTKEGNITLDMDGYIINKKGITLSPNIPNVLASSCSKEGLFPAINISLLSFFGMGSYYIDSNYKHFPTYGDDEVYFDKITPFREGVAGVYRDSCWRILKSDGQLLTSQKFENVKICSDGLIPVQLNKKWKFLDKNGRFPFSFECDSCDIFFHGLAYVECYEGNSTIKGYIDKNGHYIWQTILRNQNNEERL